MAEYSCSICKFQSKRKDIMDKHINKKIKCGEGIAYIIEIPVEIKCEFCNKFFSCNRNLEKHLKICKKLNEDENKLLKKQIEILKKQLESANEKIKELQALQTPSVKKEPQEAPTAQKNKNKS